MSPVADTPLHRQLGLTDDEYAEIGRQLDRAPNDFELAVFSLLWSEHCGYKHSRRALRRFPTTGGRVLQGPGENAGIIDAGDGLGLAFKVESHNHPSAIEPFQGAATGVGGILRDIFAMGARPIAILDSLRFGELTSDRSRALLDGVVRGVGHYGNCVGVPNVGGEVVFEPGYEQNCLVNAMCVGVVPHDRIRSARANGPGNLVVLFGARTGRDGIGGASVLASQDIDQGDAEKRPSVQIGDPFMGKLLIEASLALVEQDLVVALQDCGAAGIASSTSEMASRGPVTLVLDLDAVPQREPGMQAFEIMVSESQERMIAIVEPPRLAEVEAVCRRWDLDVAVIGHVEEGDRLVCRHGGAVVGDIPVAALVDACPRYDLEPVRPARLADAPVALDAYPAPADHADVLVRLLAAPNIASKRWVYEQYDQLVGSGSVVRPGADAGVVRLSPGGPAFAVSLDGNGRRIWLDPRRGGREVVCEAARNVACAGGLPVAITNGLNFGNPERGETPYMLVECIEGMSEACEALDTPVVSGNVSLYNEHAGGPIPPTPMVGCVGLLDRAEHALTAAFASAGDTILLLSGTGAPALDGSEYQRTVFDRVEGRIPDPRLAEEAALCRLLATAARDGIVRSAHDVSDGGLAVALAECLLGADGLGADVTVDDLAGRPDVTLFGEGATMVVLSATAEQTERIRLLAADARLPCRTLGRVTGDGRLRIACGAARIEADVPDLVAAHAATIPSAMEGR